MDGGIRVVLVDDDAAFVDLTATHLECVNDRIRTHTETSPQDALAPVREADPEHAGGGSRFELLGLAGNRVEVTR